jgi:hypothetical protein
MNQSYLINKILLKKYAKPLRYCQRRCLVLVALCMFFGTAFAQTAKITVTGKVTDTTGVTLPGVSVAVVNNSKLGTQTDVNGRFILRWKTGHSCVFLT